MTTQQTTAPALSNVTKTSGVAGQYSYSVDVTYPGEETTRATFVHSIYGGPVVLVSPMGTQVWVSAETTARCGSIITEVWLLSFFGLDPTFDRIA